MGKQIDKIRAREQMSPQEILAGLIWERAVNSRDHIFRVSYYQFPCYIEYCHEHEAFTLDTLYLGQERSFMLIQPDYRSVLGVSGELLNWLDATFATCCPPEPPRPRRSRKGGVSNRQQLANFVVNTRAQNTPLKAPKQAPSKGQKRRS